MAKKEETQEKITVHQRFSELQHALRKVGLQSEVNAGRIRYKFTDMLTLRLAIDQPFKKYGFYFSQPLDIVMGNNGEPYNILRTIIFDTETGNKFLESCTLLKPARENNPQDVGSDITYLRRYSLFSLLGLAGDKDTDCFMSDDEIKEGIKNASSSLELKQLYSGIRKEQREEFKNMFNKRAKELKENQIKEEDSILKHTSIK